MNVQRLNVAALGTCQNQLYMINNFQVTMICLHLHCDLVH